MQPPNNKYPYTPRVPLQDNRLFRNYSKIIEEIKERLPAPGISYAIVGGTGMDKSSILKRIERDLLEKHNALTSDGHLKLIPVYLRLPNPHLHGAITPRILFKRLMSRLIEEIRRLPIDIEIPAVGLRIDHSPVGNQYEDKNDFESDLWWLVEHLDERVGPSKIVLLVDDVSYISEDEALRSNFVDTLLTLFESDLRSSLGFVLACNKDLPKLLPIRTGNPLGNFVTVKYLYALSTEDSCKLIREPIFEYAAINLSKEVIEEIDMQTGGHPHLIHSIMYEFCIKGNLNCLTTALVEETAANVANNLREIAKSIDAHIEESCTARMVFDIIYQESTVVSIERVMAALPGEHRYRIKEALDMLTSLGAIRVVNKGKQEKYVCAGKIFRQWFDRHIPVKAQIFLCYARSDEEKVRDLHKKLSQAGFSPWLDKMNIKPGEVWDIAIKKAVRESDFFLACLSSESVGRRGVLQKEIKDALEIWREKLDDDIYLIPVRLEECEIPDELKVFQWADFFEEDGFDRLVGGIKEGIDRLGNSQ